MTRDTANFASKIIMPYNYTCVKHQTSAVILYDKPLYPPLTRHMRLLSVCVEKLCPPLQLLNSPYLLKRFVLVCVGKIFGQKNNPPFGGLPSFCLLCCCCLYLCLVALKLHNPNFNHFCLVQTFCIKLSNGFELAYTLVDC